MTKGLTPLISILVPVYNTHRFLNESLTSIKNQTYSNLEIICIDDGSSDGSFEILKIFAEQDSRFKVFTRENKGVGYTRNELLSKIKREYFTFVDSDDKVTENYIEKLYNTAKETGADIVRCRFWESHNGKKEERNNLKKRTGNVPNQLAKKLLAGYYDSIVCIKLIKTSLLRNSMQNIKHILDSDKN